MKRLIALALALIMVFALVACGQQTETPAAPAEEPAAPAAAATAAEGKPIVELDKEYTFRWGHTTSPTDINNLMAEYFAEQMSLRTNGKVTVEVYPSAMLGTKAELISYCLDGTLDFVGGTSDTISQWVPSWQICDLPYMVTDYESADAVYGGPVGDRLLEDLKAAGGIGLGFGENGFRQIYNNVRPVKTAEDLQGLKLRAMETPIAVQSFQSWGVDPTVITWSEVYSSLQQGTVDGADGPEPLFANAQMQEVVKYMSTTNHFYTMYAPMMSKKVFDTLPVELQELILEVGKETCEYHRNLSRAQVSEATERMKAGGLEVYDVPNEVRQELASLAKGVYAANREAIGPEFFDWAMEQIGFDWQ